MREDIVSDDDLAIRVAKEKLAQLREHPGYAEALVLPPRGTRTAQVIFLVIAAVLVALAQWERIALKPGPLRTSLFVALLVAIALVLAFAVGTAPREANEAWAAAVLATDGKLRVMRDDGSTRELSCSAPVLRALRVGDAGVARVRETRLVDFKRL